MTLQRASQSDRTPELCQVQHSTSVGARAYIFMDCAVMRLRTSHSSL